MHRFYQCHSKGLLIIFLNLICIFVNFPVRGETVPHNWPWRGFVVVSSEGTYPEDIVLLRNRFSANALRLTLKPKHLMRQKVITIVESWQQTLNWAHSMLDACKENEMTAVLSFSQFLYDQGIDQWEPEFWDKPDLRPMVLSKVEDIVKRFSNRGPELGAYEFFTEPVVNRGRNKYRPGTWPKLLIEIIKVVRKYDHERFICVTPGPGALPIGYRDFNKLDDPHIIYTAHMYYPHAYTHQGIRGKIPGYGYPGYIGLRYYDKKRLKNFLAPLIKFQKENDCFVWISEFSAPRWAKGSDDYIIDIVSLFEENSWGWTYFAYGSYHAWNPYFNSEFSTDAKEQFSRQYAGEASERWLLLKSIFQKYK